MPAAFGSAAAAGMQSRPLEPSRTWHGWIVAEFSVAIDCVCTSSSALRASWHASVHSPCCAWSSKMMLLIACGLFGVRVTSCALSCELLPPQASTTLNIHCALCLAVVRRAGLRIVQRKPPSCQPGGLPSQSDNQITELT